MRKSQQWMPSFDLGLGSEVVAFGRSTDAPEGTGRDGPPVTDDEQMYAPKENKWFNTQPTLYRGSPGWFPPSNGVHSSSALTERGEGKEGGSLAPKPAPPSSSRPASWFLQTRDPAVDGPPNVLNPPGRHRYVSVSADQSTSPKNRGNMSSREHGDNWRLAGWRSRRWPIRITERNEFLC